MLADGLEARNPPAPADFLQEAGDLGFALGWGEHAHVPADGFGFTVAVEIFSATVPTGDDAIEVFAEDGIVRRIDDSCQTVLALLRLAAFGNVAQDDCKQPATIGQRDLRNRGLDGEL